MEMKYIAVNNDHGWGKGDSLGAARKRSLVEGRRATFVRVWEIADGKGDDAYVDGMGVVYGVKPETVKDYKRAKVTSHKWSEVPHDPKA